MAREGPGPQAASSRPVTSREERWWAGLLPRSPGALFVGFGGFFLFFFFLEVFHDFCLPSSLIVVAFYFFLLHDTGER